MEQFMEQMDAARVRMNEVSSKIFSEFLKKQMEEVGIVMSAYFKGGAIDSASQLYKKLYNNTPTFLFINPSSLNKTEEIIPSEWTVGKEGWSASFDPPIEIINPKKEPNE